MKRNFAQKQGLFTYLLLCLLSVGMGIFAWRLLAEPQNAFGPDFLVSLDFGTHTEQYRLSLSMDETTHHPWGYCEKYLAGHGHTYESSVPILGTIVYPFLKNVMALSTWRWTEYFLSFMLIPICLFWAVKLFRIGDGPALLASFWGCMYTCLGYPLLFAIAGPMDKNLALAAATLAGLAAYHAWSRGGVTRAGLAVCLAVFAGYVHRSAVLWLALMLPAGWILMTPKSHTVAKMSFRTLLALLIGVLASLPWLVPLLRFWGCMDPLLQRSLSFRGPPTTAFFQHLIPSVSFEGHETILWGTAAVHVTPWILGLGLSIRNFRRDTFSRFTSITIGLFLLFFFLCGRIKVLKILEPMTFFVPATFLLIIRVAVATTGFRHGTPLKWFLPGIAGCSLLLGLLGPSYLGLIRTYDMRPSTRIPPVFVATARLIQDHALDDTRIAVQEATNPFSARTRFHMVYPLAVLGPATTKSYLGYCSTGFQSKGVFASFWDDVLLGLNLTDCPGKALYQRLLDYNVGWIVTYTPATASCLSSMPPDRIRQVDQEEGIRLFRVQGHHTYFYRGSGEVQFLPGIIRLKNLKADRGAIVIKAHYVPGLRSTPPSQIQPYPIYADSAGFIQILNPPEQMEIRMSMF